MVKAEADIVSIVLSVSMLTGNNSKAGTWEPVSLSLVLSRNRIVNVKNIFLTLQ